MIKRKMIKKGFIFLIVVIISMQFIYAHQPRLVYDKISVYEQINNPEISQAFYGQLKGQPDYYFINSTTNFNLYLNILAPDIKDARTDFSVKIFSDERNFSLNEKKEWERFYEEFGGDSYLMGPEFEENVTLGVYLIEVSNSNNLGRYSLAVGKIESFPLNEALKSIYSVFRLKHDFFNKSYLAFFQGIIGKAIGILILIIIIITLVIIFLIKKFRKKRSFKLD